MTASIFVRLGRPAMVAAALLVAWQGPARAQTSQPVEQVERLYAEGAALFKAADFGGALKKFQAAYAIIPVANLLYNMGRCYEALGDADKALEHYKQCMNSKEASGEAKLAAAQRYEALLKARVAAAQTARPVTPVATEPAPPPARGMAGTRIAAWTTAVLAVGLIVGGGVTYGLGAADHNEITGLKNFGDPSSTLDMTRVRAMELNDSGKTKKTIGVALLGVGGAAAATALVLFLIPQREEAKATSSIRVLPEVAAGGGGLVVRGAF